VDLLCQAIDLQTFYVVRSMCIAPRQYASVESNLPGCNLIEALLNAVVIDMSMRRHNLLKVFKNIVFCLNLFQQINDDTLI
jgi:hypothetical protein